MHLRVVPVYVIDIVEYMHTSYYNYQDENLLAKFYVFVIGINVNCVV